MAPEYAELVELLVDGARYGDLEDVQAALEHSVDANAKDDFGRTALHMAAANGHCDVIQVLLDHGANVGLANEEGNTALHWACLTGQEQAVRLLMRNGASPSSLNRHERTPVDEALDRGHQKVVDLINSFSAPSQEAEEVEVDDEGEKELEGEEGGGNEGAEMGVEAMLEDREGQAQPAAEQQQQR